MDRNKKNPVLEVKNLEVLLQLGKKQVVVVDQISFDLYPGKTLALVGESGCGKSMSALALIRALPQPPVLPPKGEVLFEGENLLALSERQMQKVRGAKISMIFQDPMSALNPVYTIGNQLEEVVSLHLGLEGEEAYQKILTVLDEVEIREPEKTIYDYPHQLSGGMKQRVMIAMALLCEPKVLIADEPTTALDVTVQKQVLELMRRLQKRHGMAILLITHDMGVVAEMADEVVVMYATQAVERGSVYDIFDRRAHPYTQGLFNSLPWKKEEGELQPIVGSVPLLHEMPQGCHFHPRCPKAMECCKSGIVPSFSLSSIDHQVRCWLHDKD